MLLLKNVGELLMSFLFFVKEKVFGIKKQLYKCSNELNQKLVIGICYISVNYVIFDLIPQLVEWKIGSLYLVATKKKLDKKNV